MPAIIEWLSSYGFTRVGLGTWRLCGPGRPARASALETIRAAYDGGARLFDTADSYGVDETEHGYGEILIADALDERPSTLVITKGGFIRPRGVWEHRASNEWIKSAIEASAARLRSERIPCYLLHAPDPRGDIVKTMEPIYQAQEAGRIRWVGVSNVTPRELERLLEAHTVDVVQNRLSVTVRPQGWQDVLRICEQEGIAFIPYTPLGPNLDEGMRFRVRDCEPVRRVAEARGVSPEVVALAWLLGLSPVVLVLPGARRPESILDSLRASSIIFDADEMAMLQSVHVADYECTTGWPQSTALTTLPAS